MMTQFTDAELISRTRAANRTAFHTLCERHRARVVSIALRALGNADDAQDIAQQAFVYLFQKLEELREPERLAGWLHALTLSLCSDYRRRRGTRTLGEPITMLNEASEERNLVENLMLRDALAHLPEAQRLTFLLHYEGGWTRDEIARLLDIPINTVRSRLMSAKQTLRTDLSALSIAREKTKLTRTMTPKFNLSDRQLQLLSTAFPDATVREVTADPEPWMPFKRRVRLSLADGTETVCDLRDDIRPEHLELHAALNRLGVPAPNPLTPPISDGTGGYLSLCAQAKGENLLLWALGGTPHRIRLATERAFEGIDRLQSLTDALRSDPVGAKLPTRTLQDEANTLTDPDLWSADAWLNTPDNHSAEWRQDDWFRASAAKVQERVSGIEAPLVFTHYLHFFPNSLRIIPSKLPMDTPISGITDKRYTENPLCEFVSPFGGFGDPLLGLSMVWIYDCYPFVHTGFVEQYLWQHDLSRREFAPCLALRALQVLARECSVTHPSEDGYAGALRGYVEWGLGIMK